MNGCPPVLAKNQTNMEVSLGIEKVFHMYIQTAMTLDENVILQEVSLTGQITPINIFGKTTPVKKNKIHRALLSKPKCTKALIEN